MANALDAVLALKQSETDQRNREQDQITQAVQLFQQARQQATQNKFAELQYKAGLAEKGLIPDPNSPSGFKRDTSLQDPLSQLLMQGKAAEAQKNILEAGGPNINLFGSTAGAPGTSIPQLKIGGSIGQTINQSSSTPNQGIVSDQTLNVAGVPISTKVEYPAADAAKVSATDMAKEVTAAKVTSSRDTAQLQMVAQGIKNLNEIHKNLVDKGYAGDIYRGALANNIDKIPSELQKNIPEDVQKNIGKFTSARNEILVKVQPILSQQFGQAGSVRIMESLVNLSKGEFGDLSTPRGKFIGQAEGTLGSLFRIKMASDRYIKDLKESGQEMPKDESAVAQGIYSKIAELTPEQDKQLQGLIENTLGEAKSFNSIKDAESSGLPKGTIININGRKARID